MIEQLGKGCEVQPIDKRDFVFGTLLGAPSIDWSKEFRLVEPPDQNQNGSLSCVSQAWTYFHWQLTAKNFSRRSLYSRIFLPEGGAYLRDGGKELTDRGQATRSEISDPNPQEEQAMRKRDDITPDMESDDIQASYFQLENDADIDTVAYAINKYKGVVFGVRGTNAGWQDLTNPRPPLPSETDFWGHALYGMGYHLHNGQKCIIAKSSWCTESHKEHHIKQDYFDALATYNSWVLIPKETLMKVEFVKLENKPRAYGFLVSVPGSYTVTEFTSETEAKGRAQGLGLQILKADGSIDYTKARSITL